LTNKRKSESVNFKPPSIVVNPESPWENDDLKRQEFGSILEGMINAGASGSVIALDAGWGHGKTTFLKRFRHSLERNNYQVVSYNAWENDYTSEPLVALIEEFTSQCKVSATKIKKLKQLSVPFLKHALPAAVSLASAGLIKADSDIESVISSALLGYSKAQFEAYSAGKKSLKKFKKQLAKVAEQATDIDENGKTRPLVFLIDELDRCRPDFSINTLEVLKHVFGVPGVVFVIALDKEQLGKSICSTYGAIDPAGYLARFIDFTVSLPAPNNLEFCKITATKMAMGDGEHELAAAEAIAIYANHFGFSFRSIEQLYTKLTVAIHSQDNIQQHLIGCYANLLAIRKLDREVYDSIVTRQKVPEEFYDQFRYRTQPSDDDRDFFDSNAYRPSAEILGVSLTLSLAVFLKNDWARKELDSFPKSSNLDSKSKVYIEDFRRSVISHVDILKRHSQNPKKSKKVVVENLCRRIEANTMNLRS